MRARRFSGPFVASCVSLCALVASGCVPKARQAATLTAAPAPTRAQVAASNAPAQSLTKLLKTLKTPQPKPLATPFIRDKLGELRSVALSRDKRSVAIGTLGQSSTGQTFGWVFRRDARNGALLGRWPVPAGVSDLALSPDGKKLATVGKDTVSLWSWPAGKLLRSTNLLAAMPMMCDFSPDSRTLAVADNNLTLFDVTAWKPRRTLPLPDPPFVVDAVFAPDGRHLATSHFDIEVELLLWDMRTRRSRTLDASWPTVFSPDGRWLAARKDDEIVLFSVRSGRRSKSLRLTPKDKSSPDDPSQDLTPLTFSPDSRYLLGYTFYEDNSVPQIWDVRSGKHLKTLPHIDGGFIFWVEARVLLACSRDSVRRVPLNF